jgi:CheR methyltransferase, SAM binding domain
VFPVLIRKTPAERYVRIWAPGCSTGEEAYSLAICFLEAAEQMRSAVQIPFRPQPRRLPAVGEIGNDGILPRVIRPVR